MFEETEKHFALVRQELQNLAEKQSEEGNVLEDAMAKINEFEKRSKATADLEKKIKSLEDLKSQVEEERMMLEGALEGAQGEILRVRKQGEMESKVKGEEFERMKVILKAEMLKKDAVIENQKEQVEESSKKLFESIGEKNELEAKLIEIKEQMNRFEEESKISKETIQKTREFCKASELLESVTEGLQASFK